MTHRQRRFHAPADLFLLAGPGGVEADEDVVLGLGVGHDVHGQDLVPTVQYSTVQYIQYRTSYPACLKVDTTTTPSPPRPPYTITLPGMMARTVTRLWALSLQVCTVSAGLDTIFAHANSATTLLPCPGPSLTLDTRYLDTGGTILKARKLVPLHPV